MQRITRLVTAGTLVSVLSLGLAACGGTTTTTSPSESQNSQPQEQKQEEQKTTDLAVGTTVNFPNGLSVTVDSVQTGLKNFDGSTMTGIHVTYVNNGKEGADYNPLDWKGQDANGAQQREGYYSEGTDVLKSGTLAAGGTASGNVYFDGDITKALYYSNGLFDDSPSANWNLQ